MILRPFPTTITTSYKFCSYFIGILTTTVHLIGQLLDQIIYDTFTNPAGIFYITDVEISALPPMSSSISSSWKNERHTSAYVRIQDTHAPSHITEDASHHYSVEPRSYMSYEPHDTHHSPLTTSPTTSASIPSRTIHKKKGSHDLRDDYLHPAPPSRRRHVIRSDPHSNDSSWDETHHANPPGRSASRPDRVYQSRIITHSITS